MKLLRLIGSLDPAHGGPPVSAVNSCIAARRAGVETCFAFPLDEGRRAAIEPLLQQLRDEKIEIVTFPLSHGLSTQAERWGVSLQLARWIISNRKRFDLIHCHGAWQMGSWVATLGNRRRKVVMTPHESLTDFDIAQSPTRRTARRKRRLKKRYLRRVDLFTVASNLEARDSFPPDGGMKGDVVVIPHPIHDEGARELTPRIRTVARGELRMGFLGRLHQKKRVDALIRTLPRLGERVTLSVAGDGPEEGALVVMAEKIGVADRVEWLGFVQGEKKQDFFGRIDLLVLPSDYECFGMAAAQAMVEGIPVIVSNRTGIAEIVRSVGGGEVCEPGNDRFIRLINDILHDPNILAVHSRDAIAAAGKTLSFAAHGAVLKKSYERLLSARRIG
jgi:glycosyltransferase involved in cell wall biosynthesis